MAEIIWGLESLNERQLTLYSQLYNVPHSRWLFEQRPPLNSPEWDKSVNEEIVDCFVIERAVRAEKFREIKLELQPIEQRYGSDSVEYRQRYFDQMDKYDLWR